MMIMGTMTDLSPPMVQLDGSATPVPCFVGSTDLIVNDRVACEQLGTGKKGEVYVVQRRGGPVKLYEEYTLPTFNLANGWQDFKPASTAGTFDSSYARAYSITTALFTAPTPGIYEATMSCFTSAGTAAFRFILQFGTALNTGAMARVETDGVSGQFVGASIKTEKHLATGDTIHTGVFGNGGLVGISCAGLVLSFRLIRRTES
jgi:hypothetical protein